MELGLFKQLSQLDPMVDVGKPPGLVVRMSPEPWGLMSTAYRSRMS